MPYSRLDDTFAFDPHLLELGNAAFAVVARSISYCGAQLTDGFIPRAIAETFDPGLKTFASLSERGVFVSSERGFTFPNWASHQWTRKQVEEHRALQRKKGSEGVKGRERDESGRLLPSRRLVRSAPASSSPILSSPNPLQSKPEPELSSAPPRTCPAVEALNQTARASRGRLGEVEKVEPGHAIGFNRSIGKAHPPSDPVWTLIGEWLAAGAEGHRQSLTYDVILAKVGPWGEAAKAWERAGRQSLGGSVLGRKQLTPNERDEEYNHYHTGALEKYRAMDRERADAEQVAKNGHHLNGAQTNGKA